MKILALERDVPGCDTSTLNDTLLEEEARAVWHLCQSGMIRETYFRADRRAAVLVLECGTVEEARALLSTLPLVKQGVIEFDFIPLATYTGFQRLFKHA
jgi:hypothetical protein